MVNGPWGANNKEKQSVDLMVMGEIIVKHFLYLRTRPEKVDFIEELHNRFYVSPVTKFADELINFKTAITGNATMYNDTLLFVMAITADLVEPEIYFEKLLNQYKNLVDSFPENNTLVVSLTKDQHFECIFFALRFFIDQADLIIGLGAGTPEEPKPEDNK